METNTNPARDLALRLARAAGTRAYSRALHATPRLDDPIVAYRHAAEESLADSDEFADVPMTDLSDLAYDLAVAHDRFLRHTAEMHGPSAVRWS